MQASRQLLKSSTSLTAAMNVIIWHSYGNILVGMTSSMFSSFLSNKCFSFSSSQCHQSLQICCNLSGILQPCWPLLEIKLLSCRQSIASIQLYTGTAKVRAQQCMPAPYIVLHAIDHDAGKQLICWAGLQR